MRCLSSGHKSIASIFSFLVMCLTCRLLSSLAEIYHLTCRFRSSRQGCIEPHVSFPVAESGMSMVGVESRMPCVCRAVSRRCVTNVSPACPVFSGRRFWHVNPVRRVMDVTCLILVQTVVPIQRVTKSRVYFVISGHFMSWMSRVHRELPVGVSRSRTSVTNV